MKTNGLEKHQEVYKQLDRSPVGSISKLIPRMLWALYARSEEAYVGWDGLKKKCGQRKKPLNYSGFQPNSEFPLVLCV